MLGWSVVISQSFNNQFVFLRKLNYERQLLLLVLSQFNELLPSLSNFFMSDIFYPVNGCGQALISPLLQKILSVNRIQAPPCIQDDVTYNGGLAVLDIWIVLFHSFRRT